MTSKVSTAGKKGLWVWVILVVVIVVGVLVYHAALKKPTGAGDGTPYRIGAILPLSGSLGFMGKMEGDGMSQAVEDINKNGGVNGHPLELKFDDSQGNPDIGVTAAQRMLTVDGIKIIVSSFSGVVLGIKPIVEHNGGILIGACMHPDFFKGTTNVFRFYIGVEDESKGFVDYLTALKGKTPEPRIGLLYVEAPNVTEQIERYVEPGLSKAGMSFVVKESYRQSDKEFRDKILKIRSANITHLLIIGYGFLYPNIFQELKDQKLLEQIQIIGGWGFLYPNVSPVDLEGVVVVGPEYVFKQDKHIDEFYQRFEKKFGYKANFDAAMTYAAIEVLARGLANASDNAPASIAAELRALPATTTLLGSVMVGKDGAMSFKIGIGVFKKGQIVSIIK